MCRPWPALSQRELASFTRCGLLRSSACTGGSEAHTYKSSSRGFCCKQGCPHAGADAGQQSPGAWLTRCLVVIVAKWDAASWAHSGQCGPPAAPAPCQRRPHSRCRTARRRACCSARLQGAREAGLVECRQGWKRGVGAEQGGRNRCGLPTLSGKAAAAPATASSSTTTIRVRTQSRG